MNAFGKTRNYLQNYLRFTINYRVPSTLVAMVTMHDYTTQNNAVLPNLAVVMATATILYTNHVYFKLVAHDT